MKSNNVTIDNLFFELIRVSIGVSGFLSKTPTNEEWKALYEIAKKQSLVGVCFAGVHRLAVQKQEPPEMLYLTWMGMAAKIQQRNEIVNQQCAELQAKLSADGFRSCILKGQGVGQQYAEHLRGLRQSGDIDVWIEGGLSAVLQLAEKYGVKPVVAEHHVDLPVFDLTEVEAHFTPSYLRCPWHNRRLQRWFEEKASIQFGNRNENGWCVPTTEFNLVFLMLHAFRHLTSEGVGLRQVMDYYFVLRTSYENENQNTSTGSAQAENLLQTMKSLGLMKFAGAMMYVLQEVFGMKRDELLSEPDVEEGRYLLNEIMTGGNFGHYDNRVKVAANESKMTRYLRQTKRNMHQLTHYPTEAFFSPWWRAKIWVWRKKNGSI